MNADIQVDASRQLLNYKQAGDILGIDRHTVSSWVRQGILPQIIMPGRVRGNRVTLQAVLDVIEVGLENGAAVRRTDAGMDADVTVEG